MATVRQDDLVRDDADLVGSEHADKLAAAARRVKRYDQAVAEPSPQYVRDLSITGEFATISDGAISNVIEEVVLLYQSLTAEDLYERVIGLHTAHILKSALTAAGGQNGGKGALTRAKVGPLEKQFADLVKPVQLSDGLDDSTEYGRRCKRLLKSRLPAMRTSMPG